MNESEFDTPEARRPPDYKVAHVALWVARCADMAYVLRIDFEVFERISLLASAINEAITVRGARVGEVVEGIKAVRPLGSILRDLSVTRDERPTIPAKPPRKEPDEP